MKKLILYFMLFHSIIMLPSEIYYTTQESSPLIQKYPPLTLGNITLTSKQLTSLSDEERQVLVDITHPSCISRRYGLSNQLMQPKDLTTLANIVKKHPQLFISFEITVKERNTHEYSCDPYESLSCGYVDTIGRFAAVTALGAYFFGSMIPACMNPMTYLGITCLSSIPAGCCITELGNFLHYRCCTGQKKYVVSQQ